MKYDLIIGDSIAPLVSAVEKSQQPVILWGHSRVGKSAFLTEFSEKTNFKYLSMSPLDIRDVNGSALLSKYVLSELSENPRCLIEFDCGLLDDTKSTLISGVMSKYFYAPFFESHKIVLTAHPTSSEQSLELLSPELYDLCYSQFNGKFPKYSEHPFDESSSRYTNVALMPSPIRWAEWANGNIGDAIAGFIQYLLNEDKQLAWLALYGWLFEGWASKYISPVTWERLDRCIKKDDNRRLAFQRSFTQLSNDITCENWILEDVEFTDSEKGNIKGIHNIAKTIRNSDDYEEYRKEELKEYFDNALEIDSLIEGKTEVSSKFIEYMSTFLVGCGKAI